MSGNIAVPTTISTSQPVKVPHLGNTGGINGRLDGLDDRLFAAHMRNGRLWTAHNIAVNNTGWRSTSSSNNRNASRWYELQDLAGTPTVLQAGTLFDNNATNDVNQRSYWIPSIMVSGQGMPRLAAALQEPGNASTPSRRAGSPEMRQASCEMGLAERRSPATELPAPQLTILRVILADRVDGAGEIIVTPASIRTTT